jgi:CheY-like chemotaxis protein
MVGGVNDNAGSSPLPRRGFTGAAAFWPTGNVGGTHTAATADTDTRWIIAGMVAPRAASWRALIVEDEASIREIVRLHLSLAGFVTEEVADGRAALDRLRTDRFDLVVLDVMLPGGDGVARGAPRCRGQEAAIRLLLSSQRPSVTRMLRGNPYASTTAVQLPRARTRARRRGGISEVPCQVRRRRADHLRGR